MLHFRKVLSCCLSALLLGSSLAGAIPAYASESGAVLVSLKVSGKEAPIGVDEEKPSFSWQMQSDALGAAQKSYEISVKNADGEEVWNSGTVESAISVGIPYEGEALMPGSAYTWDVTVTDALGETLTASSSFETAKLSGELSAWEGASWIGADELPLDAATTTLFDIKTKVQIPEGSSSASVIFGANDYRYTNALYNIYQLAGDNYFRVELDVTDVENGSSPAIKVYRTGFFPGDDPEVPYAVVDKETLPITNLDELITAENAHEEHEIELRMQVCTLTVWIDGEMVMTGETVNGWTGESTPSGDILLADWGNSDVMSVPNLNQIGFAAGAGEQAIFTDFRLENPGYGTGVLFSADTGATYSIWDGAEGLSIDGNTITVDGGSDGMMAYADPSYGAKPMLRRDFTLGENIASARLYVSFQGIGHIYLNGQEVASEEWFKQGSMEYRNRIGYNVYDVTELVHSGENAIGAVLGEGWWTGHAENYDDTIYNYYADQEALLVNLVVKYESGESETLISDENWQCYTDGPVRSASLFEGERYDATKEAAVEGFYEPGFSSDGLRSASLIETRAPFAGQALEVRKDENVHVIRTLDATLLGETKEGSGSYLYDLGENVAAAVSVQIPAEYAKPGETLTIRMSEILYPELEEYGELAGNLLQENYRAAMTTDFYTMKEGDQTFVSDLTFHGFRYLEITGAEALPQECVKSLVLSSIDNTATYESSNELVNRLFLNGQNSEASNYITLPTDCPQRNERMGWMGDANVYALAGSYNADTYQFMRQWLSCVRDTQGEDGMTGHVSPNYPAYDAESGMVFVGGLSFGITWNSAIVFIPYFLFEQYGDKAILEENIDAIYSYMENLASKPLMVGEEEVSALTSETGFLCDHLSVVSTDGSMLGNAMYAFALQATSAMASALGQEDKAASYAEMAQAAREAWNKVFIDEETGKSRSADGSIIHTQASYASPLNYGVILEENLERFGENFIDTIENPVADDGTALTPYTLTTGFNATPNLLNALSLIGRTDVAYKMLECQDYASWLYPVVNGATSIWERWNSYTIENGFGGNNGMNSFNHYSLGAVTSWMMDTQLGIRYDEQTPGYSHFTLQPVAGGSFTYARGSFESAYGTIESGWEAQDSVMTSYTCTVPANTTATLYLPGTWEAIEGATLTGTSEHLGAECTCFELTAGSYVFEAGQE